jgi:hypothetical protein
MEAMQVTKPTPNRNSRKSWEKNRLTYVAGARIETFDPFSLMKLRDLVKMNPFHKPIKKLQHCALASKSNKCRRPHGELR